MARSNEQNVVAQLALLMLFTLLAVLTQSAQAQTYTVLYNFTGGLDGNSPQAGLSMDRRGNLYGTTSGGGYTGAACHVNSLVISGCGTAFKVARAGTGWVFSSIYLFTGDDAGAEPSSAVVFGPDGDLYGTAFSGGNQMSCGDLDGCGAVYKLSPSPTVCKTVLCPWTAQPAFVFQSPATEGALPMGDLIFDPGGNIYGTTVQGGNDSCGGGLGCGAVFKLSPSGGSWIDSVVYAFEYTTPYPTSGVIRDASGKLYGTTSSEDAAGSVFELTPSGSGWAEDTLYVFNGSQNGSDLQAGLVLDAAGNLVGGTLYGGHTNFGTLFQLNPLPNGSWDFNMIYNFRRAAGGPKASLVMDSAGSLYGTAHADGAHSLGSVFKLTPSSNGWIYTDLHDFTGADGSSPISTVLIDANGNLYGTTAAGGTHNSGVVWEITP